MCKQNVIMAVLILIIVSEYPSKIKAFRAINVNGEETILALENEMVNMECRSDLPIAYCGFLHATGKRYSFTGRATSIGKCSIKIKATTNDTGEWRCHIGTQTAGVESMKIIHLRVVGNIAAVQKNITAVHGKRMTLFCTTTKGFVPLSYCRFEPPNGLPFSIDSSVTEAKPLMKRYYYPSNKSLDRGDCAVTIRKVKYEDAGTWTCGAGFDDGNEYIDAIQFDVEGLYTMSTASATGITFGTIGIIAFLTLLGFFAWKRRSMLGSIPPEAAVETHELERLPSRQQTPHSTPQPGRSVPIVTVESPSQKSVSPGASTPLMPRTEE